MINQGKVDIAGVNVSVVDYEAAVDCIITAAKGSLPFSVSALAVHGVMTGALDGEHRTRLNALDMVTPDGQPVRWAMKFLHGISLPDRVYGPNLTLGVCKAAADHGIPIYLYGSRMPVLNAWIKNLEAMYPKLKIAGFESSKFKQLSEVENREMIDRIKSSGAGILFVGLGCPRQEVYIYENTAALSMPALAVGAAFDFHAGLVSQAPKWMQDRGLEWLYRLIQEPSRLWKRYLILNPYYVYLIAKQKLKVAGAPQAEAEIKNTLHYG